MPAPFPNADHGGQHATATKISSPEPIGLNCKAVLHCFWWVKQKHVEAKALHVGFFLPCLRPLTWSMTSPKMHRWGHRDDSTAWAVGSQSSADPRLTLTPAWLANASTQISQRPHPLNIVVSEEFFNRPNAWRTLPLPSSPDILDTMCDGKQKMSWTELMPGRSAAALTELDDDDEGLQAFTPLRTGLRLRSCLVCAIDAHKAILAPEAVAQPGSESAWQSLRRLFQDLNKLCNMAWVVFWPFTCLASCDLLFARIDLSPLRVKGTNNQVSPTKISMCLLCFELAKSMQTYLLDQSHTTDANLSSAQNGAPCLPRFTAAPAGPPIPRPRFLMANDIGPVVWALVKKWLPSCDQYQAMHYLSPAGWTCFDLTIYCTWLKLLEDHQRPKRFSKTRVNLGSKHKMMKATSYLKKKMGETRLTNLKWMNLLLSGHLTEIAWRITSKARTKSALDCLVNHHPKPALDPRTTLFRLQAAWRRKQKKHDKLEIDDFSNSKEQQDWCKHHGMLWT